MNESAVSSVCRLCAEFGLCINIFSELGRSHSLQSKIAECLSLAVGEQDILPRSVCLNCITKLNTSFELKMTCLTAQAKLQALSICSDSTTKTDVPQKAAKTQVVNTNLNTEIHKVEHYFMYPDQVLDPPESTLNGKDVMKNASNTMGLIIKSVETLDPIAYKADVMTEYPSARMKKKDRKTVCQYCRKWFPRTIIEHHENLHIKGGIFFTCIICNNNFRTKQEFASHKCD